MRLGLYRSGDATFGGQDPKSPNLKLAKLKHGVLAEITKFIAHQTFPLYSTY